MAKIVEHPRIELNVTVQMSEVEARALEAVFGYGIDAFLGIFYEKMGRSYLEPHEDGLRSLAAAFKAEVPRILGRLDKAKQAFKEKPHAE